MTKRGTRGNLPRVGKIFGFRKARGRRLKGLDEFRPSQRMRFWPEEGITIRGVARDTLAWLRALRPFILLAVLLSLWPTMDARLAEPPALLATGPELVDERFTRCAGGRAYACVVDGDTFRLGDRSIRIIGIDAPEVEARCPEEARLAAQATTQLLASLNAGPFEMVAWAHNRKDRYGRELMAPRRVGEGGNRVSIAEEMRRSGLARRYLGGFRGGWC